MKNVSSKRVDYDLDKNGKRIRKYVIEKFEKMHGRQHAVWVEDTSYMPSLDPYNKGK